MKIEVHIKEDFFKKYEAIAKSSASSFSHSDPDRISVGSSQYNVKN
jgi:hypothetical protein